LDADMAGAPLPSSRSRAVDVVRGAVMVLMAIDHVRVYAGVPAGGPDPAVFFTRWVTHFCAPAFVFLAGTSAFLQAAKAGAPAATAGHLVLRGLWLILLELTVLRLAWTFNLRFDEYVLAGVIWMLGWSFIALAALMRLPFTAIVAIGLAVVFGHNLMDLAAPPGDGDQSWLAQIAYRGGVIMLSEDGPVFFVLYSLVPWIGVIALGYGFGRVLTWPAGQRDRWCLRIGLAATALFVLLRATGIYGNPSPWPRQGGWLQQALTFLNTTKYPASLQFLLMTLGPTLALMPLAERARGPLARMLEVFGRAPMFYYLLHIPLIHLLAIVVDIVRRGGPDPWLFANHPAMPPPPPPGYRWSLWMLYAITLLAAAILYFPCRWMASQKAAGARWARWV
jgi:uncharacterized membrane protein